MSSTLLLMMLTFQACHLRVENRHFVRICLNSSRMEGRKDLESISSQMGFDAMTRSSLVDWLRLD